MSVKSANNFYSKLDYLGICAQQNWKDRKVQIIASGTFALALASGSVVAGLLLSNPITAAVVAGAALIAIGIFFARLFLVSSKANGAVDVQQASAFNRLPKEMTVSVLSFLERQDLRSMDQVGHYFHSGIQAEDRYFPSVVETTCERLCKKEALHLPRPLDYKQLYLKFHNMIGPDFYEEHFGSVDVVPIPKNFIENPRLGFRLVYIPEYITIEVDENSSFELYDTGKQPRLRENLERNGLEPTGKLRTIEVPITLNNLLFLVQKCLKKGLPSHFAGISYAWQNIIDQHGDVGIGSSRWSYQKEAVMGLGQSYGRQKKLVEAEGLAIVPLLDRLFFDFTQYIKTGQFPQNSNFERTVTVTYADPKTPCQSAIWWPASGPSFRLDLDGLYDVYDVGAAAGVPAGSS